LDFYASKIISSSRSTMTRRFCLLLSCLGNLGVLAFFKYGAFAADTIARIGFTAIEFPPVLTSLVLPVGISFYTFQSMSYTIDVYRKNVTAEQSFLNFAIYVSFFPQLVAGPILRSGEFLPQLAENRSVSASDVTAGIDQIVRGLFKKAILADGLATYVDQVFLNTADMGGINLLLGIYAFSFQIYMDFSGYTDIAIGTARLMGFSIPANFNLPYLAANPTEHWRRWHISLSTWFRDYVYIPLGGSRRSASNIYFNIVVTMTLSGLWHGAAWGYIVWGAFHGVCLVLHRALFRDHRLFRMPRVVSVIFTYHLVCFGWIFFRASSLDGAFLYIRNLTNFETPVYDLPAQVLAIVFVGMASHILGASKRLAGYWRDMNGVYRGLVYAGAMLFIFLYPIGDNPAFIYFQF
jgi:alginate O-acetyltransferase complex protein AlgI